MTTTSGISVTDRLKLSHLPVDREAGVSHAAAIEEFSRDADGAKEVIDGLRVLRVPVDNKDFCDAFIMDMLSKAIKTSHSLISNLDSAQTIVQLFKMRTVHKLTHLFASDVVTCPYQDLSNNWNVWESDMSKGFSDMIDV